MQTHSVFRPTLWHYYLAARREHPDASAHLAHSWAKERVADDVRRYLVRKPETYSRDKGVWSETYPVPGIGILYFELKADYDHNLWDDIKTEWVKPPENIDKNKITSGQEIIPRHYFIGGNVDSKKTLCLVRTKDDDREADYKYWHSLGYSKQDARVRAYAGVKAQCEYWADVSQGAVDSWGLRVALVGALVSVNGPDYVEPHFVAEETEVWGYTTHQYRNGAFDYIVSTMNEWAENHLKAILPKVYGDRVPPTLVRGISPEVDIAWRAWDTAMVVGDGDRSVADPIFIDTYRRAREQSGPPRSQVTRGRRVGQRNKKRPEAASLDVLSRAFAR